MTAIQSPREAHTHKAFAEIVRHITAGETPDKAPARHTTAIAVTAGLLRLAIGWVFLWAFLDKTFGLGYATPGENAWVDGGSPTTGFLSHVDGTFAGVFNDLAGQGWADWLFMAGLLGIGAALVLGVFVNLATVSGALLLWRVLVQRNAELFGDLRIALIAQNAFRDILTNHWPLLEPLRVPTAGNPNVAQIRVTIHDEVAARRLLVVTGPRV